MQFDILKSSESLFKDESVLNLDYIPPIIRFRENTQEYIASCIKPLLQKRNSKNLLIFGPPGIGKTLAVKHLFNELAEKSFNENVFLIYINCWKKDTAHKIILEICNQINYKFIINKTTEELLKNISFLINKKSAVIILDEADKIKEPDIIYNLLEDLYRKSLFLITNEQYLLSTIDKRILSRLMPEPIEFKPYTYQETYEILKQRIDYAFVKNVFDQEALKLIAEKAYEFKDIRTGLFLLRESGLAAESFSSKKILKQHSLKALDKLKFTEIRNSKELETEDSFILSLIQQNPGCTPTSIFSQYKEKYDKSYRTLQRKLKELEEDKVISFEDTTTSSGSKTIKLFPYTNKKLSEF